MREDPPGQFQLCLLSTFDDEHFATAAAMAAFSTFLDAVTADGGNVATVTLARTTLRSGAGMEAGVPRRNICMNTVAIHTDMHTTASPDGELFIAFLGTPLGAPDPPFTKAVAQCRLTVGSAADVAGAMILLSGVAKPP